MASLRTQPSQAELAWERVGTPTVFQAVGGAWVIDQETAAADGVGREFGFYTNRDGELHEKGGD